jgi:DNA polymerase III subunit delta
MAELNYKKLESYLSSLKQESFAPVYLVHGEEYLIKSAFSSLLDAMVPGSKRSFGYEPVDEDTESTADLIERLNTFSLMSGTKVVSLCDSKIFHSRQDLSALLKKCKTADDKGDRKKAARYLNSLLSLAGVEPDEARTEKGKEALKYSETFQDEGAWLDELLNFLAENPVKTKESGDSSRQLKDAIEKGFPKKHHLIITSDIVDKRKALYTTIKEQGMIIDCSVPKGDRKADKDSQDQVLKENMSQWLKKSGKTLDPDAYRYVLDITGFDLRTFMGNLEKLIVYTGERKSITLHDARSLLKRTKQDPIYELSGAIAERNLDNALFFTGSLLANDVFPLQIMATIVNQLRRLILARDFIGNLPPGAWRPSMDYNGFRASIMPRIKDHDARIAECIVAREQALNPPKNDGKKEKKVKAATDLILAKNPNSPYPVFLLLKNAGRYSLEELIRSYEIACKADIRLKSSGENPRLILDDLIIKICSPREK